jgi:hypothetical protein
MAVAFFGFDNFTFGESKFQSVRALVSVSDVRVAGEICGLVSIVPDDDRLLSESGSGENDFLVWAGNVESGWIYGFEDGRVTNIHVSKECDSEAGGYGTRV